MMIAWLCKQAAALRNCNPSEPWYVEFARISGVALKPEGLAFEIQRTRHHKTAHFWSLVAIGLGLAAAVLVAMPLINSPPSPTAPPIFWRVIGVSSVVLLAATAAGGLIGFLFGIPRTGGNLSIPSDESKGSPQAPETNGKSLTATKIKTSGRSVINTNLEEVSDWLTKIILGAGLTQIGSLTDLTWRLSLRIGGDGFADSKHGPIVALGLIVYGLILGLISTYILTRIYLSNVFTLADRATERTAPTHDAMGFDQFADATLRMRPQDGVEGVPKLSKPNIEIVAKDSSTSSQQQPLHSIERTGASSPADTTINDLKTTADLAAYGRAQFNKGEKDVAKAAFAIAVSLDPQDYKIRQEFGAILSDLDEHWPATENLLAARKILPNDVTVQLREELDMAILYNGVYSPPPEGFTAVLAIFQEAFRNITGANQPQFWTYVACAYGQKYGWLKESDPNSESRAEMMKQARDGALESIKAALATGPDWKDFLRALCDPKDPDFRDSDQDLVDFKDDPDFRTILEIPEGH